MSAHTTDPSVGPGLPPRQQEHAATDALAWASSTAGRFRQARADASILRPSPDNARLAYMMLASMGG